MTTYAVFYVTVVAPAVEQIDNWPNSTGYTVDARGTLTVYTAGSVQVSYAAGQWNRVKV